jgi:hypothetical protein
MTMDNGLVLGSTAGLIAVGGAWATHPLGKANPNSCSRSEAGYTPSPDTVSSLMAICAPRLHSMAASKWRPPVGAIATRALRGRWRAACRLVTFAQCAAVPALHKASLLVRPRDAVHLPSLFGGDGNLLT